MTFYSYLVMYIGISWGLSEVVLSMICRTKDKDGLDRVSYRLIFLSAWLGFGAGIFIGVYAEARQMHFLYNGSKIFPCAGSAIMLAGMAVRWAAILTLKRYFTVNVTIRDGHEIVQKGLYKYTRHPSYLGAIISAFGLGISFGNWLSFIVIFFPYTLTLLARIRAEEVVLLGHFGGKYEEYMKRTKMLIPFIY